MANYRLIQEDENLDAPKKTYRIVEDTSSKIAAEKPKKSYGPLEFADNVGRKFASGASYGWADEFAAKMDELTGRGDYGTNVDKQRAIDEAFAKAHPVISFAAETAGALASPITRAATLSRGANLVTRYGKYFLQGAGLGALGGAGNATEGHRSEGAAVGGVVGGALGTAIPAAIEGISALGRRALARVFANPTTPGMRALSAALSRDNLTVDDALSRLDELGPESTISDLGPNTRGLARAVTQMPGTALTAAEDAFNGRNAGTRDRVVQAAFDAAGVGSLDDLIAARSQAAAPLYEAAFAPLNTGTLTTSSRQIKSPALDRVFDDPLVQRGIRSGIQDVMTESRITGIAPRLEDYALARSPDTGRIERVGEPTLRLWDSAKRGLDIMLNSGSKDITNPQTGRLTQRGVRVQQLRDLVVNELDRLTTDDSGYSAYRAAREAWAGPTATINALSHLDDVVSRARDGSDITGRLFGSPAARERLAPLFSDETQLDAFRNVINGEREFFRTSNRVLGNSSTQFTNAAQADLANTSADMAFEIARNPSTGNIINQALTATRNYFTRPPQEAADELAPILFSNNRGTQTGAFNAMQGRLNFDDMMRQWGPLGNRLLSGGSTVGGASGGMFVGSNQ